MAHAECTCETYGHCHVCRSAQGRTEPRGKYSYQSCAWCGHTFVKGDMFVLDDDHDHHLVCGSACPKRPNKTKRALRRERDRPSPKPKVRGLHKASDLDRAYVVRIVVDVPMWAHNTYSARRRATRLIRGKHRVGIISSSVERKEELTDTNT